MIRIPVRMSVCAAFALVLAAGAAQAQGAPPTRNGNVYDGTAHEPSAPSVAGAERAEGVAPSEQRQKQEDREIEQLNRELQQRAH